MPEGDTLCRTATVLRDALAGRQVIAARGRPDGAQLGRVVGSQVERVEAQGKHLLIAFGNGLTLHTHLRMHGSWHRYRTGERWRRSPARAVAVIEVPNAVAVCFDAPTVELMDTRALAIHPALSSLGPDLLAPEPDLAEVVRRLGEPACAQVAIGEALLDQTVMAGLGNVYRTELLWEVLVSPFVPLAEVSESVKRRLVETGAAMLRANLNGHARVTTTDALGGPPGSRGPRRGIRNLNIYGRAGRPCPRCGTAIRTKVYGDLARRVFWCPTCQA
jgi:endonuclease-8